MTGKILQYRNQEVSSVSYFGGNRWCMQCDLQLDVVSISVPVCICLQNSSTWHRGETASPILMKFVRLACQIYRCEPSCLSACCLTGDVKLHVDITGRSIAFRTAMFATLFCMLIFNTVVYWCSRMLMYVCSGALHVSLSSVGVTW